MDDRVPYSVRKERLRQAKLAEEARLAAAAPAKDSKAYVVEVQIPVTPEPILLQSKTPVEEVPVMDFANAPRPTVDNGPAEMISSVEIIDSIESEPVVNGFEDHGSAVVVSSMVVEEALPDQTDFVVVEEEAPAAESVVTSMVILPDAEEPVVVEAAPPVAEEPVPVEPEPVLVEEAVTVEAVPVVVEEPVAEEPVAVEEAKPVEAEPIVVEEAPQVQAEPVVVEEAPVAVEVVEKPAPEVVEEVVASPVVEEEKVVAPPAEVEAPAPVVEAPAPEVEAEAPAPVVEDVPLIPEKLVPTEDAEPEITLQDFPTFLDLIYWRDVKKTGVVFGSMLFILLSLAIFSVLSVVAYLSLAILAVTLSFRVYKNIMQAVQKSGDGHPFKDYLEWDIELNDAKTSKVVKLVMKHFNCTVRELRRLFLVEDLVDSIKFGLLLWVLTYIGSWFNGMTLIINSVVIVFTLPKVYETYKVQIDNYLAMARSQFNKILQQVQAKLPFLKKKAKAQ